MPGDVGLVAQLLNILASWALSPDGYTKMKREEKIDRLQEALKVALDQRAFAAADLVFAELRKLSQE